MRLRIGSAWYICGGNLAGMCWGLGKRDCQREQVALIVRIASVGLNKCIIANKMRKYKETAGSVDFAPRRHLN